MPDPFHPARPEPPLGGSEEGNALWRKVVDFIGAPAEDPATADGFGPLALEVFRYQAVHNPVYARWLDLLGWNPDRIADLEDWSCVPALPVEAFKWSRVLAEGVQESVPAEVFRTSGTTGDRPGTHHVRTPGLYRWSAIHGFARTFGAPGPGGPVLLALLPGYLERPDSSLVHMVRILRAEGWMEEGGTPDGGFHLEDRGRLFDALDAVRASGREVVLIGVTWALVDAAAEWAQSGRPPLESGVHIVVTGGMKGRREEWVADRIADVLGAGFGCPDVAGEYGMTELLSQAWSRAEGIYHPPHWMRVRIRRTDDPFALQDSGATGGADVVDLANLGSCSFLSTRDLVRPAGTGTAGREAFALLGRFDHAEVRGCNLMVT